MDFPKLVLSVHFIGCRIRWAPRIFFPSHLFLPLPADTDEKVDYAPWSERLFLLIYESLN